jgi:mRNA interferase RelE/StbE
MPYSIEFSQHASRDLKSLSPDIARRVMKKILTLQGGLRGDIKRMTNFRPAYRLRVGDYRVLFDVEGETIIVYRVRHRREAYGP